MADELNQRLACYAQSDANVKYLAPVVARLLKTIPDVWTAVDLESLTSDETRVLDSLKAVGMVELRDLLRVDLLTGDFAADITIESHGEKGHQIAMDDAYGKLYGLCKAEIDLWEQQGNSVSPFSLSQVGCLWKLTSRGCMARESMSAPELRNFAIQEALNWGMWRHLDPLPGEGTASVVPVESHSPDATDSTQSADAAIGHVEQTPTVTPWHAANEEPPAEFEHGAATATLKAFGEAFGIDWRTVPSKLGPVRWGRKNNGRSYSIWFKNKSEFDRIVKKLAKQPEKT